MILSELNAGIQLTSRAKHLVSSQKLIETKCSILRKEPFAIAVNRQETRKDMRYLAYKGNPHQLYWVNKCELELKIQNLTDRTLGLRNIIANTKTIDKDEVFTAIKVTPQGSRTIHQLHCDLDASRRTYTYFERGEDTASKTSLIPHYFDRHYIDITPNGIEYLRIVYTVIKGAFEVNLLLDFDNEGHREIPGSSFKIINDGLVPVDNRLFYWSERNDSNARQFECWDDLYEETPLEKQEIKP